MVINCCIFCGVGLSLQEWVESRSRELRTKEKKKMTENGQTTSTISGPVELEAVGQRREEQETGGQPTARAAGEVSSNTGKKEEVEVPLVRKKRRLTNVRDMLPTRGARQQRRSCLQKTGTGLDKGRRGKRRWKTCQSGKDLEQGRKPSSHGQSCP